MLCAFSQQSGRPELLATVSSDGRVNLWDTVTSTLRLQLARPTHLASRWTSVAWQVPRPVGGGKSKAAPPGLLALGSDTGLVVVWDVQRGEVVHELEAHTQRVNHVLFGSGVLLSCGDDRLVKSWSCESGELIETFKAGKAAVHRLALSADDAHVLLAGTTIRLMRREGWKRLQRLPGALAVNLSPWAGHGGGTGRTSPRPPTPPSVPARWALSPCAPSPLFSVPCGAKATPSRRAASASRRASSTRSRPPTTATSRCGTPRPPPSRPSPPTRACRRLRSTAASCSSASSSPRRAPRRRRRTSPSTG